MPLTAHDAADTSMLPVDELIDRDRADDIASKHRILSELIAAHQADGVLLQDPDNLAWFTSGADFRRLAGYETRACLFVTRDSRVIVTSNVESAQVFDLMVPQFGFQVKERPWLRERGRLVQDLCRGRGVLTDRAVPNAKLVADELDELRQQMTPLEAARYRVLGKIAVHAVEATARRAEQGQTESEIAGQIAHRLIKRQVEPVQIQVAADDQLERYRHWHYGERRVDNAAVISAVVRGWGLCVGLTRTLCFGSIPEWLAIAHNHSNLILATGLFFSQDGTPWQEVWQRVQRIYEKFGMPHEWKRAHQVTQVGYRPQEQLLIPGRQHVVRRGQVLHWHPSVMGAMSSATGLVTGDGLELLTGFEAWPIQEVKVKGQTVKCPGILPREV